MPRASTDNFGLIDQIGLAMIDFIKIIASDLTNVGCIPLIDQKLFSHHTTHLYINWFKCYSNQSDIHPSLVKVNQVVVLVNALEIINGIDNEKDWKISAIIWTVVELSSNSHNIVFLFNFKNS